MQLGTDERRALGVLLGLLLLASLARWIERPRPLLTDLPELDIAALEDASRAAKPTPRASRADGSGAPARPGTGGSAADAGAAGGAVGAGARADAGVRVDVNMADVRELQRLPGIGPAVAQRIVEERSNGVFTSLDDLQRRVRGIGPALAARLGEHVTLPASRAAFTPVAGAPPPPVQPPAGPALPGGPAAAAVPAGAGVVALDLNRASVAELENISGVGPILAARLVARRDSLGGFSDWSEVDAVPGVGPAMLARLKGLAVIAR
jgi:competence protein ComEA